MLNDFSNITIFLSIRYGIDEFMKSDQKRGISPYLLVILSFVFVILIGALILTFPFSQKSGQWGEFIDSLFVATSATCVTGLCTYKEGIGGQLTFIGQLTVLILIQIGGLGFITVLTFLITLFKKRLQFKNRYFLSQAVGSTSFAAVIKFVRKLILISFIIELIGFLLFIPAFYTIYKNDPKMLIWSSIFTSISAFNNAGFDIFGSTSLIRDVGNVAMDSLPSWAYYYICSVIMLLITFGGLSFLVIMEMFSFKKKPKQYKAFTKIVILTSFILLVGGCALLMLTDGMKSTNRISLFDALFQSVTCRTAGFANFNQENLSTGGYVVSCLLMFVGGSPLSTAGGIKTTTAFIIVLAIFCYLRGKKVVAFKRSYSSNMILKAMSLVFIAAILIAVSFVGIGLFERNNPLCEDGEKLMFEVVSAFGTVGLSANLTPTLALGSKIILILLMFLGRLGPITFFQIFQNSIDKEEKIHFKYVEEDFLIG